MYLAYFYRAVDSDYGQEITRSREHDCVKIVYAFSCLVIVIIIFFH